MIERPQDALARAWSGYVTITLEEFHHRRNEPPSDRRLEALAAYNTIRGSWAVLWKKKA